MVGLRVQIREVLQSADFRGWYSPGRSVMRGPVVWPPKSGQGTVPVFVVTTHICTYIYIYVCICVYVYMYTYICILHMHVYVCDYVYDYVYVYVYVCICICISILAHRLR